MILTTSMKNPSIKPELEAWLRMKLEERLNQCLPKQQEFFPKVYPIPVPFEKLIDAIDLCDRTLAKNLRENRRED